MQINVKIDWTQQLSLLYFLNMKKPLIIQGREVQEKDILQIRGLLSEHPDWNRSRLSVEICKIWNWRRFNGELKDIACREYLRKLEMREFIVLPPRQSTPPGKGRKIPDVNFEKVVIQDDFNLKQDVSICNARDKKADEKLFNCLLKNYHYLSFSRPVGESMKYLIKDFSGAPLGCMLFGSAAWKLQERDDFIGWDQDSREKNLCFLTNNTRFLILPWVKVTNLASFILAKCLKLLNFDWQNRYGHEICLVETFVDRELYHGTCYKAANWLLTGQTKGRGRQDRYTKREASIKDIYLYPLKKNYNQILTQ